MERSLWAWLSHPKVKAVQPPKLNFRLTSFLDRFFLSHKKKKKKPGKMPLKTYTSPWTPKDSIYSKFLSRDLKSKFSQWLPRVTNRQCKLHGVTPSAGPSGQQWPETRTRQQGWEPAEMLPACPRMLNSLYLPLPWRQALCP